MATQSYHKYSQDELDLISSNFSLINYFSYLESKGTLKYIEKHGHDYYFKDESNEHKYSVSDKGFYDFKNGKGGGVFSAIQKFENIPFGKSIEFAKNFSNTILLSEMQRKKIESTKDAAKNYSIEKELIPNNKSLLEYFAGRGISKETLQEHAIQLHYKIKIKEEEKHFFAIALKNKSDGYDLRNSLFKSKLGKGDISIVKPEKQHNGIVIFEGMTDLFSFIELQKHNNIENNKLLISLNSVTNVNRAIEYLKNSTDKIYLCLDGDLEGQKATDLLLNSLETAKDVRHSYNINSDNNNDLNSYLINKLNLNSISKSNEKETTKIDVINVLSTGAEIYFETKNLRLNQNLINNNYVLNIQEKGEISPSAHIEFNNLDLALKVAKEINKVFPNGTPFALDIERYVNSIVEDLKPKNQDININEEELKLTIEFDFFKQLYDSENGKRIIKKINHEGKTFDDNEIYNDFRSEWNKYIILNKSPIDALKLADIFLIKEAWKNFKNIIKNNNNENTIEPNRLSNIDENISNNTRENNTGNNEKSESELERNHTGRPIAHSQNDGDGFESGTDAERTDNRTGHNTPKPFLFEENSRGTFGVELIENSSNVAEVDIILNSLKNNKITNDKIAELVNFATFVTEKNTVELKENLIITDDLLEAVNQFKSGGIEKKGRGILDEYYTEANIIDAIIYLLKDDLKDKKNILALEPSAGTGNFLNEFKKFNPSIQFEAFEINEVSARISKIVNPSAEINLRSFETEFIEENGIKKNTNQKYDLIVGNPPYGQHRGFYKGLGEEPSISKYEDYFIKRSLDQAKNGALIAMVLPSSFLAKKKEIKNAELVNAYRLPSGAFKSTQIGTDIVILKKKDKFIDKSVENYFLRHPEKILGEIYQKTNQFGKLENFVKGNLEDALQKIKEIHDNEFAIKNKISFLGELNFDSIPEIETETTTKIEDENSKKKILLNTTIENVERLIKTLENTPFKTPLLNKTIVNFKDYSEKLNSDFEFSEKELKKINKDAFKLHEKYAKNPAEYKIIQEFELDKKTLKYHFQKNDITNKASIHNSKNISDNKLKAFQNTSYDGILNDVNDNWEFANLYKGEYYHDFYYVEGNIYEKLEQLEKDFEEKLGEPKFDLLYEKQKKSLESVLPTPKNLENIIINPNHEFVHNFFIGSFETNQYNYDKKAYENVMKDFYLSDVFLDFLKKLPSETFEGSSYWEVYQYVKNEQVTGSDKERNALVRERRKEVGNLLFNKFIKDELSDDDKERFVNEFNRKYNNIYIPDYKEFPLFSELNKNFKGSPLKLTEVQKSGIGRLTTKGVGLLAHEVGFGKTLSGVLSLHEAMQRGNSKRPLIVVPNQNILKQWAETIFEAIPDAKVNILGNLGKDYDLSRFKNYDNEITLVTYEGFNNIGFSENITKNLASKFSYISDIELSSLKNISERDLQIAFEKQNELEGKMKKGKLYDWEDFGFDHFTFDEVHNANHIVGKVKIEDRRFASDFRSQNQRTSAIGINTWMASQYIQDKYDGRNVTLLSATPFTNKPLEYYSILSLIANKRLEELGYFNVNNFFETFMEADNDMEINAKGDVQFKTNIRRFKNNDVFQRLLSEFIDIKGEEDNPELVRPNRINKEYKIEQNDLTKEQYQLLNDNFSEADKGAILTHILNGRLTAISPFISRYYDGETPNYKDFIINSPKLNLTMELIKQNKKDADAGQIIYSELAIAKLPLLKEYLVKEVGYGENEVALITGVTNKAQRDTIQEDYNNGKIKIIIGSEAIQEGMNLQNKTSDLYLLSLPYNFTSLRQVEGRAWRQGNEWENVRINYMLTNDSIDVFMLQKLQEKQNRYLESIKGGVDVLEVGDIDTLQLKTALITNPSTRAEIEIKMEEKKLEAEKKRLIADSSYILRKFENFNNEKSILTKLYSELKKYEDYVKNGESSEFWKNYVERQKLAINKQIKVLDEHKDHLKKQGVNIDEIEKQINYTDDKINEIDDKLSLLPNKFEELKEQFEKENKNKTEGFSIEKLVAERKEENKDFFVLRDLKKNEIDVEEKTEHSFFQR